MGRRLYSRRSNGRFRRATLENTFGLSVLECPNPDCRLLQPYGIGDERPTHCHTCGTELKAPAQEKQE